jgi:hypothetical protein
MDLHRRSKRKFGTAFEESPATITASMASSVSAPTDSGVDECEGGEGEVGGEDDDEDVTDLGGLAEKLISAAEADDRDDDNNSGTIHTLQNSSSAPASGSCTSKKALIPLKDLLIYPSDPAVPTKLEFYWKGGITKLEETLMAYEPLSEMGRYSNDSGNARVDDVLAR